jgi:hypothetical protein
LEPDELESIERAGRVLFDETPLKRKETQTYSKMMKNHFGKIAEFHERGYSFAQICAACEQTGLLPKSSDPHCFRQAFRRERTRLERCGELVELVRSLSTGIEGKAGQREAEKPLDAQGGVTKTKPEPQESNPGGDAAAKERERIRKMTGVTVNTGLATIVKHSDGSFDY